MGLADPTKLADAKERFWPLAKLLNDQLAERKFLLGERVTLADFVVAGAATYMERGRIPINDYSHIKAWPAFPEKYVPCSKRRASSFRYGF